MSLTTQTHWRGIGVAFLAGVAAATALIKASPAALALRESLQLSMTQIGWVMSAGTIASCALGVISGQFGYWRGARALLRDGLLLLLLAGILSALAPNTAWLLCGRGLEGLGVIFVTVAAPTLIASMAQPRDMGLAMGIWALWMPVGSLCMLVLAPVLLTFAGWRGLWMVSGFAALLVLGLATLLPRGIGAPSNGKVDLSVLRRAGPWWLALAFFCFSSQFFSVFTFLPMHLTRMFGLSADAATLISALVPLAIIPGNLIGGVFVQRGLRPVTLLILPALLLLIVLPALLVWAPTPNWEYALLAVYGFLLGMIPTGIFTQAPLLASRPAETGPILGLALTGQGFGILCGPPLIGAWLERSGNWNDSAVLLDTILLGLVACGVALRQHGATPGHHTYATTTKTHG
jgi:predicted MFS family arabinose efflux permease